jgi:tRNA G18 (ribose-2'-O)-methylase SpoU
MEESFSDLKARGYSIFAFDMHGEARLGRISLPEKSAFVFGNEGKGISFDFASHGVRVLSIPQFGSMESLNVSVAASIAMYEYVRERGESPTHFLEKSVPRERKSAE